VVGRRNRLASDREHRARGGAARPSRKLADRLAATQRRHFVGRDAELALFRSTLAARERSAAILHVFGPGGIGKTSLLQKMGEMARSRDVRLVILDGRSVAPTSSEILHGLRAALELGDEASPLEGLARAGRTVLVVDTYEVLASLDRWFCDHFLPQLPAHCLTVLAGRDPPSTAMIARWGPLLRLVPLRYLDPDESRSYLRVRGVPLSRHPEVLEFTHGHPLALSLVADVLDHGSADVVLSVESQPDVVRTLLQQLLRNLPGPRHRAALEATAHVRVMTEDRLALALDDDDVQELFEWLRGLSIVQQDRDGLFLHDLVRDLVDAELRWRNPEGYRALHRRVREHIIGRIRHSLGMEQQRALFDLLDLHRSNPVMKPMYQWSALGSLSGDPATPADRETIEDLVRLHEGKASQELAGRWFEQQPGAFTMFRDREGTIAGFAALLLLDEPAEWDPAIESAWSCVGRRGPLRPGERLLYQRFFISRESYQQPGPVFDMGATMSAIRWITTPRLAWSFAAFTNIEVVQGMFAHLHFGRCPEADYELGGKRVGVFGHDWRVEPVGMWLDGLADREIARDPVTDLSPAPPPVLVLSRADFADAVKLALRDLHSPERLAMNPLLRSRLVLDRVRGREGIAVLRDLLAEAVHALQGRPADAKFERALRMTYLEPAPTQELAAERLSVPFGTYRYQLATALDRVTDWLWRRELEAPDSTG
jgi:hypothetical protein